MRQKETIPIPMKTKFALSVLTATLLAAGSLYAAKPDPTAESRIEVVYDHPENFTDLKDSEFGNDKVRDAYMKELKEHLESRASRYVAEGQKLSVTITDIDMAGDFEPWRGPRFSDVRIVKDIYPPRINLSFKLTDANGMVIKEDKRELRNMSFQMTSTLAFRDDPLRYEKELLDDWMRSDFSATRKKK
jgi:hypothetical protein